MCEKEEINYLLSCAFEVVDAGRSSLLCTFLFRVVSLRVALCFRAARHVADVRLGRGHSDTRLLLDIILIHAREARRINAVCLFLLAVRNPQSSAKFLADFFFNFLSCLMVLQQNPGRKPYSTEENKYENRK